LAVDATRLINALQRDPALLYEVGKRIVGARILGPWEPRHSSMVRRNLGGTVKLNVEKSARSGEWLAGNLMTGSGMARLPSMHVAQVLADHYARIRGWAVVEPVTLATPILLPWATATRTWHYYTLAGNEVAWFGHEAHRNRWLWGTRTGPPVTTTVDYADEKDDALQQLQRWADQWSYVLLPITVTGLLDPRQPENQT